ncbi:U3 small nucleolar RNA associated protein 14 [Echinococcus multilocularis]|uniref:U3 small nucleolar RNA associated protein 14 n=1 Tax=Echinococcus multilocularis TaxID=6211 RepID=A0A0S4MKK0_ECHMU|nr:U3 small nucleolar RNA associated protein 14 [Echinococcus multilocularis]CUT98596.1 U3 small nucleolar RNA associated protein 14 [Echinococcus multilocularis]CUT98597.1 U3 small nucleolar RNA associated protein 14 [Echinococcus multilocularis]
MPALNVFALILNPICYKTPTIVWRWEGCLDVSHNVHLSFISVVHYQLRELTPIEADESDDLEVTTTISVAPTLVSTLASDDTLQKSNLDPTEISANEQTAVLPDRTGEKSSAVLQEAVGQVDPAYSLPRELKVGKSAVRGEEALKDGDTFLAGWNRLTPSRHHTSLKYYEHFFVDRYLLPK